MMKKLVIAIHLKKINSKKGKSGNPKGRPKGALNLDTILRREMDSKVQITEGGKQIKITKKASIVKKVTNDAMSGKSNATKLVLDLIKDCEARDEAKALDTGEISKQEKLILENFKENLLIASGLNDEEPEAEDETTPEKDNENEED